MHLQIPKHIFFQATKIVRRTPGIYALRRILQQIAATFPTARQNRPQARTRSRRKALSMVRWTIYYLTATASKEQA